CRRAASSAAAPPSRPCPRRTRAARRPTGGSCELAEHLRQAELDLAVQRGDQAVELDARDAQALLQAALGALEHLLARIDDPPADGRAALAEQRSDLGDVELVDQVEAQHRALVRAEVGERLPERAREVAAILRLDVVELGILDLRERVLVSI